MHINQDGLDLIKHYEGCRLTSYQDSVGVWTIAYGHTGDDVGPNVVWDQDQANNALKADCERIERGVEELLTVTPTDNQFSALVCFAYNVGVGNLAHSHLLALFNDGDVDGAADQFLRWTHAGGVVLPGLVKRREAERQLFLKS